MFPAAKTLVVAFALAAYAASETPNGVHLHIGQNSTEMVAMWSLPKTPLASAPAATCEYGRSPDSMTSSVAAHAYTYPAGGFTGTLYICTMPGLALSTRYFYRVGSGNATSGSRTFRTPPASAAEPVRFILWADMGIQNPVANSKYVQEGAAKDIQSGNYTLIVNAGDTSYADDYNLEVVDLPNSWVLDKYWEEVQESAGNAPMMLCPGNHEDQYHFAAHLNRTLMPNPGTDGPLNRFYYSFDYGPVHFVSFSTEHNVDKNNEQWNFVVADLKKASENRQNVPWILVFTHHPFYCSSVSEETSRCGPEMDHYLEQYEEVFHQYGVDVFVAGHNHCYERTYPVYNRQPSHNMHNANGTVYVVNGAAGDIEGVQVLFAPDTPWRAAQMNESHTGYSRVVADQTSFRWEYVDAHDMQIKDVWTLTKSN